ncbi:hypothetical protein N1851_027175 [Merluccius polli]|uniref:Uncharacterized protein n=1 Tax=Merluccius polli TaxID=89951 RepID=A0AA47NUI6_MERPO|nr:hypothetical protein N1851_027175 [Merluccius polli]
MVDEVQRLRDLVSQLEADNEQLLQERAAFRDVPGGAAAGPSGSVSHAPSASAVPVMERLVVVPRERKCPAFNGKTGLGIAEWTEEIRACMRVRHLSAADQALFVFDHLEGEAREEIRFRPRVEREDPVKVFAILRELYGCAQSYVTLQQAFFSRRQQEGESLQEYSLGLMALMEQVKQCAPDGPTTTWKFRSQGPFDLSKVSTARPHRTGVPGPNCTSSFTGQFFQWCEPSGSQDGLLSPSAGKLMPSESAGLRSDGEIKGSQEEVVADLMSSCPTTDVVFSGVHVPCLVDTGSMVSTITESFFQQQFSSWGQDRLRSCNWLRLRAANGLDIPYVGYLELDVALCGKVIPGCGVLVVKDPPGTASSVPGILGMNVIRKCYRELFGTNGPSLFALLPVSHVPGPADKKVGPASVQLHSWEVLDQPLGAYLEINPVLVNRLRVVHLVQLLVSTQMSIVFHAPPRDAVTSVSHSPTSAALIHLASWCVPVIGHHDEVRCCPGSRTCPGSRSCPGSGIIRPRSSYWLGSLHVAAASVRCWVPASGSPSLVVVFDTVLLQCTGSNPRRCRAGTGPERHRVGVVEGHQEEVVRAKVTPGIIGHYVEHLTHRQGPGET